MNKGLLAYFFPLLLAGLLVTPAPLSAQERAAGSPPAATPEEEVFSGPQVGETLPPLPARYVFDDQAGKPFDPVAQADGKPLLIIFVHEVTRPAAGLTRAVGEYAASRKEQGLHTAVIFLGDDATQTEETMKRARHALPKGVELGVSPDGLEGPGAYGLDRKMSLTVLVAKEGKVTANFALAQPSLAVDAPKIGKALVDLVGGEPPQFNQPGAMRRGGVSDEEFRALLSPLIQRDATEEEVDAAAKRVEEAGKRTRPFGHGWGRSPRRLLKRAAWRTMAPPGRRIISRCGPQNTKPGENVAPAKGAQKGRIATSRAKRRRSRGRSEKKTAVVAGATTAACALAIESHEEDLRRLDAARRRRGRRPRGPRARSTKVRECQLAVVPT